jgi:hypothetical protein
MVYRLKLINQSLTRVLFRLSPATERNIEDSHRYIIAQVDIMCFAPVGIVPCNKLTSVRDTYPPTLHCTSTVVQFRRHQELPG